MIIECINCNKKFNVNSELIPSEGRTLQCSLCNHIWFFNPKKKEEKINDKTNDIFNEEKQHNKTEKIKNKQINEAKKDDNKKITKKNEKALIKYQKKNNLNFSKFLSYIIVLIVSFISIVILLDTFKNPLSEIFPNLELILFNLFETLKDIVLFMKDLI